MDIIQHKDAAACSQWARYYFHKGFLAGNQQVSSAGNGQREGITEETMWGQDKSAMGEAGSNQDAQESQAWDKESLCAAAVADPHTLLAPSQGHEPGLSQRQEKQSYPSAGQQIPNLKYRLCTLEWSFELTPY